MLKNVCQTDQQKEKVDALYESTYTDDDADNFVAVYDFVCEVLSPVQLSEIENQVLLKLANVPIDVEATPTTNHAISEFVKYLLEKFRLQEHVNQTNSHREFLKTVHQKFEEYMLQHPYEKVTKHFGEDHCLKMMRVLVKHHDISKYNLKMALGYAMRFVINHSINMNQCKRKRSTPRFNAIDSHVSTEPHHDSFWWSSNSSDIDTWAKNLRFSTEEDREYLQSVINSGDSLFRFFVLESVLDQTAREWENNWWDLGSLKELKKCSPEEVFSKVKYRVPSPSTEFGELFGKIVGSLKYPKDNIAWYKTFTKHGKMPMKATKGSVGYDVYSEVDVKVEPEEVMLISTGVAVIPPPGTFITLYGRSSWTAKGLLVIPGIIDEDYRGVILLPVKNTSNVAFHVSIGDKIGQLVFLPIASPIFVEAKETRPLRYPHIFHKSISSPPPPRKGGFGSTGKM